MYNNNSCLTPKKAFPLHRDSDVSTFTCRYQVISDTNQALIKELAAEAITSRLAVLTRAAQLAVAESTNVGLHFATGFCNATVTDAVQLSVDIAVVAVRVI